MRVALKARGRLFQQFSGAKGQIAYPDAVFCAYHLFWPERALQSTAPSALIALIRRPEDIYGALFLLRFVRCLHLPASLGSTGVTPLPCYYGGSVTFRARFFGPFKRP
jgi:hypothetical protein